MNMQLTISTKENNYTNFGMSYTMTDKATNLLNKKRFSRKSVVRIEKALENISKLKKVSVTFDSYDKKLIASIYSDEGYLRVMRENLFTTMFKRTAKFIEKVGAVANTAEETLANSKVQLIKH